MLHTSKLSLKQFCFYLTATEKDNKDDQIKTSMLLTCTGQKVREIYKTFSFDSTNDEMKLEPVLNNATILRHTFFTYRKLEGHSFHNFVTKLKKLSAECEFKNLQDSLIKDMIVCGTNAFHERLLRESDLTLSSAISAGHAAEKTRKHACKILQSQSATNLHKINKLRKSCHQAKSKEIIIVM